jgi:hypothetical protein
VFDENGLLSLVFTASFLVCIIVLFLVTPYLPYIPLLNLIFQFFPAFAQITNSAQHNTTTFHFKALYSACQTHSLSQSHPKSRRDMAPLRVRQSVSKDRFSAYLGALKTQAYHDSTNSRGTGFHGYVQSFPSVVHIFKRSHIFKGTSKLQSNYQK